MKPEDLLPVTEVVYAYEIPKSMEKSPHWRGSHADRKYTIRIPTPVEIQKAVTIEASFHDVAKTCVKSIGGHAVDQAEVDLWWGRLSTKARAIVVAMFVNELVPNADDQDRMSSTRRRV